MNSLLETLQYEPRTLTFGTSGLRSPVSDMTDLECYINSFGFLEFLRQSGFITADSSSAVYLAGDLRDSTPRITRAVRQAIIDFGCQPVYCGLLPTSALAYYALMHNCPGIMVTGSHIPADRNGIKFYKPDGEVLKEDEAGIMAAIQTTRNHVYAQDGATATFDGQGMLVSPSPVSATDDNARTTYVQRFTSLFDESTLAGKKIVFYQHSSVGRDLLPEILGMLGASVIPVGRSDVFVPIDTENVTPDDQAYFRELARQHPDAYAVISADGDSDRPFVIDETGTFHRGDMLGVVVATYLRADAAAYTASTNDAADTELAKHGIAFQRTKIGSPYVVAAMNQAVAAGRQRVVSWEVNGGFLTASDIPVGKGTLKPLPTRDALLPIICALHAAARQELKVSELFARLPQRFTQAGLIDDFPVSISQQIKEKFSQNTPETNAELETYFTRDKGFGAITDINTTDGVRIFFDNGDIAHLRISSNAPQMRIYSTANSQTRADEIAALTLAEPDGIFRRMERAFTNATPTS